MNLFFLSMDPFEAAQMQCNKHVVKMIVETAQMMSTAHRILDGDENGRFSDDRESMIYRITHKNHPSTVWVRTSVENYNWTADHLQGLLQEYTYRYERKHKTADLMYLLGSPPLNLKAWDWTPPPSCMPDECKIGSLVENYRHYYRTEKKHMHAWKKRDVPSWINNEQECYV
jgi:hypothetical protein